MRFIQNLLALALATAPVIGHGDCASFGNTSLYDFSPENNSEFANAKLPILYDLSYSQLQPAAANSFWTSSFVTASNGHQYLVINHPFFINSAVAQASASIFDVTSRDFYRTYMFAVTYPDSLAPDGRLAAVAGDSGIEGVSNDSISIMHTWSDYAEVRFDLTFDASTAVLYNGAAGYFTYGDAECGEWALPAASTQGTIEIDGTTMDIDASNSFTWYDRQWGNGSIPDGNYTWFQVVLPKTSTRASIWMVNDNGRGNYNKFATFRFENSSSALLPFELTASTKNTFTSSISNRTYSLEYTIDFGRWGSIHAKSIHDDQEWQNVTGGYGAGYEGFVEYEVNMFGESHNGFGILEIN